MSVGQIRAFRPLGNNKTVSMLTTTGVTSVTVPDRPFGTQSVRIVNSGTDITFIELTVNPGAAIPAIITSMPLLGNTAEVFLFQNDLNFIRAIGVAGGNTLYITYGEGL